MSFTEIWETLILLGGMASLWFRYILGWKGMVWQASVYVMLVLLAWVFVRRARRLTAALRRMQEKPP